MAYFNRFDICVAYNLFVDRWRWGFFDEAIAPGDCQIRDAAFMYGIKLERIKTRWKHTFAHLRLTQNVSADDVTQIDSNARHIYMGLVRKHLGIHSTARQTEEALFEESFDPYDAYADHHPRWDGD